MIIGMIILPGRPARLVAGHKIRHLLPSGKASQDDMHPPLLVHSRSIGTGFGLCPGWS
jgi:hypothetical protein